MCVVRHFFIFLVARFLFFFAFKSFTFSCSLDSSTFQRGMWWKEPWRVKDQSQVKKEKKKKRKNKRIQKKARPLFVLIYLEVKRRVLNPTQTFVNKYMFVLMWANLRLKKAACHAKKGKEWDRENEREREKMWLQRTHGLVHTSVLLRQMVSKHFTNVNSHTHNFTYFDVPKSSSECCRHYVVNTHGIMH